MKTARLRYFFQDIKNYHEPEVYPKGFTEKGRQLEQAKKILEHLREGCFSICFSVALILVTLISPAALLAQAPPLIPANSLVRVHGPDAAVAAKVGNLVLLNHEEIVLRTQEKKDELTRILLSTVTKLEFSQGKRSRAGRGLLLGLLTGAAAGALYGAAGHPGLPHIGNDVPQEIEYVLPFTLAGMFVGGIVGQKTSSERWREVPLEELRREN